MKSLKLYNRFIILTIPLVLICSGFLKSRAQQEDEILPFPMPVVEPPSFQDTTFNITDFGAIADGQSLNTQAFKKAIDACHSAGGGIVLVPPGIWLTGPVEFKSNINLHVERGALIIFSRDHSEYPIIQNPISRSYMVTPPVFGFALENIAITGEGILDGSGETWRPVKKFKTTESQWKKLVEAGGIVSDDGKMYWPTREAMEGEEYLKKLKKRGGSLSPEDIEPARDFLRPYMVVFYQCKNILFEGPTFQNSPKFVLYPTYCENMIIRNIKVFNEWWAQNGDGIDLSGGKNILISDCLVSAGDDAICMKSSKSKNYTEYPGLQNVVITGCVVYHGHGGFVIGSNTDGGIANIAVSNCTFITTDVGLRFKSSRGRGGLVENIYIKDIYMKDIANEAILFNTWYDSSEKNQDKLFEVNERTPIFQKFYIKDIFCDGADKAVSISGLPEMPVREINLKDVVINSRLGFEAEYAQNISMKNISLIPDEGILYSLNNCKDISMKKISCPEGTDLFIKLSGKESSGISVINSEQNNAKKSFELAPEVSPESIIIKQGD